MGAVMLQPTMDEMEMLRRLDEIKTTEIWKLRQELTEAREYGNKVYFFAQELRDSESGEKAIPPPPWGKG